MGMFNWVDFETECPVCGAKMDSWQTKDGDPHLATVKPWAVSEFYDMCQECDTWVEYIRRADEPPNWLEYFTVQVTRRPSRAVEGTCATEDDSV